MKNIEKVLHSYNGKMISLNVRGGNASLSPPMGDEKLIISGQFLHRREGGFLLGTVDCGASARNKNYSESISLAPPI